MKIALSASEIFVFDISWQIVVGILSKLFKRKKRQMFFYFTNQNQLQVKVEAEAVEAGHQVAQEEAEAVGTAVVVEAEAEVVAAKQQFTFMKPKEVPEALVADIAAEAEEATVVRDTIRYSVLKLQAFSVNLFYIGNWFF